MPNNRDSLSGDFSTFSPSSEYRPARLQRRSYIIALTLAMLGLVISLVNIFRAPQAKQTYTLSDLSYSQVIILFDNGASEILVSHPFGEDTLRKDSDYILLRDKIASKISESGITPVASNDRGGSSDDLWGASEKEPEQDIPTLRLDIAGSREAGSVLDFSIEDYDPSIFYYIDFGDGSRRKVDKESIFTYSKPGTYTLNLYASISEKELYDSYSKVIRIRPNSRKYSSTPQAIPEKNTNVADLFPKSKEDKLIKKPLPNLADLAKPDLNKVDTDTSTQSNEDIQISDLGAKDNKNGAADNISGVSPNEDPELIVGTSLAETKQFNTPYFDAEMMPEFPGGLKAMARYLKKNAIYPEKASQASIEGTVNVRLVVRADGSLSDLKVLKGLGYGCDDEALRLVSKMPRWIPGVQNGIYVPVYTVIPITFKLIQ